MAAIAILCCSHVAEWGGAETVLADLLATIDRRQFALHLACPPQGPLPDRARELRVPVHALPPAGRSPAAKLARLPLLARRLRHIASDIGAQLLHANSMIAGYAAMLARHRRLPCLWHLHIVAQSPIARLALASADRVVTPCRANADWLPGLRARNRLQLLDNGIAPAFFATAGSGLRAQLGLPAQAPLLGIVGRLDPDKGHEVLLQAMRQLPPAVHLAVVGSAAFADTLPRVRGYAERLQTLAASPELTGRVHLLGERRDLPTLMGQFSALVVPSTALEASPRVIAEAMAAGTPVIASDVGGIADMLQQGTAGLLVPPGQPAALAAAVTTLLHDPSLRERITVQGRNQALQRYQPQQFAAGMATAYTATLASVG